MDFNSTHLTAQFQTPPARIGGSQFFWTAKRGFDIVGSLLLFPILIISSIVLLILNPFMNSGSLFFVQTRMGRDCQPFPAIKFRTMREVDNISRGPDDLLEVDRITKLGRFYAKAASTRCLKSSMSCLAR